MTTSLPSYLEEQAYLWKLNRIRKPRPTRLWPYEGQQTRFVQSPADEALFGGAAGPGKSECLLMLALEYVDYPSYRAILFRRVFTSLEAADGLIQRSLGKFPQHGGQYNSSKHYWKFPSGARIYFAHMQHEDDKRKYQGAQFHYVAFDELTEFSQSQYTYMFTRARGVVGDNIPVRIRAATNPGGVGHEWVKQRFITRDIVNQLRYFAIVDGEDTEVSPEHEMARSRAFYPALLDENPSIGQDYVRNLMANPDPVEVARYRWGDWDAEYTEGRVYDNWSSTENVTTDAEYDPNRPYWWACDDGYVFGDGPGNANYHPRVVLFLQKNALGGVSVFNEYYATGEVHAETIQRCLDYPYPRPQTCFVDGSAAMFRGELVKASIHNANGTHPVVEGIRNLRRMICDGNGVRLLRVHPRCKSLIYEMSAYRLDPNDKSKGGEIVPLKQDDHGPDALRYGTYHMRMRV